MQFTLSTVVAFAALLNTASAHLWMSKPKMFAQHGQNEGFVLNPLDPAVGVDANPFPCQGGTADEEVPSGNSYELGEDGVLEIKGSAVHSGGSGQVVISYKFPPSPNEDDWHVLTSYQGNHPIGVEGNLAIGDDNSIAPMTFKIHESLPKGKAIIAWNWFNKSGNREHYMKCATVSIGGSTEQVSNADLSSLPTMFRANSDGGKCTVPEGVQSIRFKNPGTSVFGEGETDVDCDYSKPGSGGSGSGETPSTPAPEEPEEDNSDDSEGGDNETGDNGEDTEVTPAPEPKPEPKPKKPETPVEQPAKPPVNSPPAGGACTEGQVTCNSDGTWSLCGSGYLQNMGPLASGTVCKDGAISKRSAIRFSAAHLNRRRHHKA
jgi:hypothetical protein